MGDTWDTALADEWQTRAFPDRDPSTSASRFSNESGSSDGSTNIRPTMQPTVAIQEGADETPRWQKVLGPRPVAPHLEKMFEQPMRPPRSESTLSDSDSLTLSGDEATRQRPAYNVLGKQNTYVNQQLEGIMDQLGPHTVNTTMDATNTDTMDRTRGPLGDTTKESTKDHSHIPLKEQGQRMFEKLRQIPAPPRTQPRMQSRSREDSSLDDLEDHLTRMSTTDSGESVNGHTLDMLPSTSESSETRKPDQSVREVESLAIAGSTDNSVDLDARPSALFDQSVRSIRSHISGDAGLWGTSGSGSNPRESGRVSDPGSWSSQRNAPAGHLATRLSGEPGEDSIPYGVGTRGSARDAFAQSVKRSTSKEQQESLPTPGQRPGPRSVPKSLEASSPASAPAPRPASAPGSIRSVGSVHTPIMRRQPLTSRPQNRYETPDKVEARVKPWTRLEPTPENIRFHAKDLGRSSVQPPQAESSIVVRDVSMSAGMKNWAALLRSEDNEDDALDVSKKSPETLAGLDRFRPNLRTLVASNNQLAQLEGLPHRLVHLDLSGNNLGPGCTFPELPVSTLVLAGNQFKDLRPLANLRALVNLDLSDNKLISLRGIDGLPALRSLNVTYNHLTALDFRADLLEELDASHNRIRNVRLDTPRLETLRLDDNCVAAIEAVPTVQELWIRRNNVVVDFSGWNALKTVVYDGNSSCRHLEHIRPSVFSWETDSGIAVAGFDAKALVNCTEIRLRGKHGAALLTQVPELQFRAQHLSLLEAGIESLPPDFVQRFPFLLTLDLAGNRLKNENVSPLTKLPGLRRLNLANNNVDAPVVFHMTSMRYLEALDLRIEGRPTDSRTILATLPWLSWLDGVIMRPLSPGFDAVLSPLAGDLGDQRSSEVSDLRWLRALYHL